MLPAPLPALPEQLPCILPNPRTHVNFPQCGMKSGESSDNLPLQVQTVLFTTLTGIVGPISKYLPAPTEEKGL